MKQGEDVWCEVAVKVQYQRIYARMIRDVEFILSWIGDLFKLNKTQIQTVSSPVTAGSFAFICRAL